MENGYAILGKGVRKARGWMAIIFQGCGVEGSLDSSKEVGMHSRVIIRGHSFEQCFLFIYLHLTYKCFENEYILSPPGFD